MKTFRYRDFEIYKRAVQFRKLVRMQLRRFPKEERFRLVYQIDRAALSIILNIAEGSARSSDKDFARFLSTSVSSLNEVIAGFDCAVCDNIISLSEMQQIECDAETLAKQIGQFIKILKKPIANCQ